MGGLYAIIISYFMKKQDYDDLYQIGDYVGYLSLAAIERAKSGHPGLPLGMRHVATLLYAKYLRTSFQDPSCLGRDRFVLSAGHGSMLLYALNYVFDYGIGMDDLLRFRQIHSKTPGHPEFDLSTGVETTTGPLGQGVANAVGMAIEGKMLASRFNGEMAKPFSSDVYCLVGDGCLMEGISYEASSLAGHLGLDNLYVIYDSNQISIDGRTNLTFTENVRGRFESQGWEVAESFGNDLEDVDAKLTKLRETKSKPKLLIVTTKIGQGLKDKEDKKDIHGSPAGLDEILYYVQHISIKSFFEDVSSKEILSKRIEGGKFLSKAFLEGKIKPFLERRNSWFGSWRDDFRKYESLEKEKYQEFLSLKKREVSEVLRNKLLHFESSASAGRDLIHEVLQAAAGEFSSIIGGSADLASSTKATIKGEKYLEKGDFTGRNIAYGVREHAMAAIGNGLALNGVFMPFSSTFFSFFDYMKNALRLTMMMELPHLYIFTHDSIYVAEDGPTHEPVEHLMALRSIPNMRSFRVANETEAAMAMLYFLEERKPTALVGSRGNMSGKRSFECLKNQDKKEVYLDFKKGAIVLKDHKNPHFCFLASGSEVEDVLLLSETFEKEGLFSRVVSISSMELLAKNEEHQEKVFLKKGRNFLFELASYFPYSMFFSDNFFIKDVIRFGYSGKIDDLKREFSFRLEDHALFVRERL